MSRPLKIEFPGAIYHITSRGDRRENIFLSDDDRKLFLEVYSRTAERFGWICYAYCLMSNHYHLVMETPLPDLSSGMAVREPPLLCDNVISVHFGGLKPTLL
jgi:REP element-mobilizing transposase RayT